MLRHLRSMLLTATVAVLACLTVGTGPAAAVTGPHGNDVDLRVVNNSPLSTTVQYCPGGHVNLAYNFNATHDPCNQITYTKAIAGHGDRIQSFKANPIGVIVKRPGYHTLYFFVRNPSVGLPYIVVNGHTTRLVQGELKSVHTTGGGGVRLHREGDRNGHKIMTIELTQLGKN